MRLIRSGCVLALFMFAAYAVGAQEEAPKFELYGGYSYNYFDDSTRRANLHGWNASATWNVKNWLGLVADFGGHYGNKVAATIPAGVAPAKHRNHTFLFGPRVFFRSKERFTPYFHALVGAARHTIDFNLPPPFADRKGKGFAAAFGGGVDMKLNDRIAVRLFQTDFLFSDTNGEPRGSFRYSSGLVFRFGSR